MTIFLLHYCWTLLLTCSFWCKAPCLQSIGALTVDSTRWENALLPSEVCTQESIDRYLETMALMPFFIHGHSTSERFLWILSVRDATCAKALFLSFALSFQAEQSSHFSALRLFSAQYTHTDLYRPLEPVEVHGPPQRTDYNKIHYSSLSISHCGTRSQIFCAFVWELSTVWRGFVKSHSLSLQGENLSIALLACQALGRCSRCLSRSVTKKLTSDSDRASGHRTSGSFLGALRFLVASAEDTNVLF